MRISFRLDQLDSHAHFALFINGAKAGDLCLRDYEYRELVHFMEKGMETSNVCFTLNDNRPKEQQ